jgi:glycosyltransferase involved in cell wall biosynthesis
MRILYLTDTREIGGAERHLVDLAEGMAAAGHEVLLLVPQPELAEWAAREAPSAHVARAFDDAYHDATPAGRARALAGQVRRMAAAFRHVRPDVLHVNNGGWPGADLLRLAPLAGRLADVPLRVITVHSNPWPRDGAAQAVADRLVWGNAHVVACPSRAVADGLRERRGMQPSLGRLMYYGVRAPDGSADGPALHERLAPNGELLVGMVSARPVPEKGYDVFVDALAAAGPGVRGVLVGRYPPDLERRVASAGLDGRVELPGLRRDVGAYYHAFDVLTVPSVAEECMPLVILEAAAAGTSTFGSILSGIPEAVEDGQTGRVFPPGDAAALAALIGDAAGERERLAEMGTRARERWEGRFSLDRMLAEHEALYSGRTATHA